MLSKGIAAVIAVVARKDGWVVELLVMKLDGWWGEGRSRTVQTARTVIGSPRVVLGDSTIGRGG